MSLYTKHANSSACFAIENLLELLNGKRLRIEDLCKQRKLKLEQCIQLCYLKDEIKMNLDWILNEGNTYLKDSRLGTNYSEAVELQNVHKRFEAQHHKVILFDCTDHGLNHSC